MPDPREQRVLDDIAKFGWYDICVEEDEEGPGFNYTVGLMLKFGHPEIIIFGQKKTLLYAVLWIAVQDIEKGRQFVEPGLYEDLLHGYACYAKPVHPSQHRAYLGYAMWFCRHCGQPGTLKAVQLFWPDKAGKFPWEVECHPSVCNLQPLLDKQVQGPEGRQ
jgi:hypothetical protein